MAKTSPPNTGGELLYGAAAIAEFLGVERPVAYHWIETKGLPAFRIGGKLAARPAALRAWIAEQEKASLDPTK